MNIFSPMATGNGAYVIHQELADSIPDYKLYGYNPLWTLCPPALFLKYCNRNFPSIIHTGPDYAPFVHNRGSKLVITFHSFVWDRDTQKFSTPLQRLHYRTDLRWFVMKALKLADAVTCVSRFTADLVKKEFNYNKKISVIYNGIDISKFYPVEQKTRKKIKVLYSGNLTRRKGAYLLTHIAQRLQKNVEILYTSGLRTKKSLPAVPNLHNLGSVPYSEMPGIYQQADILLFPTVREGFGLAAAEAMACGLPVVATDCSSLPELIIDRQGGYLCEMGNVDEFAARINELAASPGLRREMGEFNRARVEEKFTVERMVKEYVQLFEQVLHNQ